MAIMEAVTVVDYPEAWFTEVGGRVAAGWQADGRCKAVNKGLELWLSYGQTRIP